MPVSFKFEGSKLVISVDSDKDGELVIKIEVNLGEAAEEIFKTLNK